MARAVITKINDPDVSGETLTLSWRHVFYRPPVNGFDAGTGKVDITPTMTTAQIKSAIKTEIQNDATANNYGTLERVNNIGEIFDGL